MRSDKWETSERGGGNQNKKKRGQKEKGHNQKRHGEQVMKQKKMESK